MPPRARKDAMFGLWFSQELERRGWNGKEAAAQIGVGEGTISKWKKSKEPPKMRGLTAIGRAFGVPAEDVIVSAGYDVRNCNSDAERADRRLALLAAMPRFADIIDRVARMDGAKQDAYLSVIESMLPDDGSQSNRQ